MEDLFKLLAKYPLSGFSGADASVSYNPSPIFKKHKGKDRVFGFGTAFLLSLIVASFPVILAFVREDRAEIERMARSLIVILDPSYEAGAPIDLESSKIVEYQNPEYGFSFMHPEIWAVADSSEDRKTDDSIVDTLVSRNMLDKFSETIFINSYSADDITFGELIYNIRNNIPSNGFGILKDQEVSDKIRPAYVFGAEGKNILLKDGKRIDEMKNYIYVFNAESHHLIFEFQDDSESFDKTSKKFLELIESLEFSS